MGRGLVARQSRLVELEAVAEKATKARYPILQRGLVIRPQADIVNGFGIQKWMARRTQGRCCGQRLMALGALSQTWPSVASPGLWRMRARSQLLLLPYSV